MWVFIFITYMLQIKIPENFDKAVINEWTGSLGELPDHKILGYAHHEGTLLIAEKYCSDRNYGIEMKHQYSLMRFFVGGGKTHVSVDVQTEDVDEFISKLMQRIDLLSDPSARSQPTFFRAHASA